MFQMTRFSAMAGLLLVSAMTTTDAWVNTPSSPQNFGKAAAMASLMTVIATSPMAANAATDFTGSYADPFHPFCLREITQVTGSAAATVSGTDGTPGCPPDGSGKAWNLVGKVEGDNILVDFTPKGGPKDLKGVWESAPKPGIRWPDGNLWAVKQSATTIE
jgi:hypothetical protein